jgi:RAB protein geranylgeranyltransferase component A
MDDISGHYDVIITGTGLTQAIIAAATARIGKTVFHCDQNEYYSQEWQSLNFKQIVDWSHSRSSHSNTVTTDGNASDTINLTDEEVVRKCLRNSFISNVFEISYLCDESATEDTTSAQNIADNTEQELGAVGGAQEPQHNTAEKWSLFKFNSESRKFNLDLCPRV